MDNPEKISALSTQDTGQRQAKQKTKKDGLHGPNTGGEAICSRVV